MKRVRPLLITCIAHPSGSPAPVVSCKSEGVVAESFLSDEPLRPVIFFPGFKKNMFEILQFGCQYLTLKFNRNSRAKITHSGYITFGSSSNRFAISGIDESLLSILSICRNNAFILSSTS